MTRTGSRRSLEGVGAPLVQVFFIQWNIYRAFFRHSGGWAPGHSGPLGTGLKSLNIDHRACLLAIWDSFIRSIDFFTIRIGAPCCHLLESMRDRYTPSSLYNVFADRFYTFRFRFRSIKYTILKWHFTIKESLLLQRLSNLRCLWGRPLEYFISRLFNFTSTPTIIPWSWQHYSDSR